MDMDLSTTNSVKMYLGVGLFILGLLIISKVFDVFAPIVVEQLRSKDHMIQLIFFVFILMIAIGILLYAYKLFNAGYAEKEDRAKFSKEIEKLKLMKTLDELKDCANKHVHEAIELANTISQSKKSSYITVKKINEWLLKLKKEINKPSLK